LDAIMRLRWIIAAGAAGLLIAFWQENVLAFYLTCLGCMLMYTLRIFSIAASGRHIDSGDSGLE
jgi:hypothetical protein